MYSPTAHFRRIFHLLPVHSTSQIADNPVCCTINRLDLAHVAAQKEPTRRGYAWPARGEEENVKGSVAGVARFDSRFIF